jgi:spore coat polysaccharide biosynthesis predicted glycosyltransferase SpsG
MADLLADADLAIGAGGTSSWERCVVGAPAIIAVVASNQDLIAASLEAVGAAFVARPPVEDSICTAVDRLINEPQLMVSMSSSALQIADGLGVQRVVSAIMEMQS